MADNANQRQGRGRGYRGRGWNNQPRGASVPEQVQAFLHANYPQLQGVLQPPPLPQPPKAGPKAPPPAAPKAPPPVAPAPAVIAEVEENEAPLVNPAEAQPAPGQRIAQNEQRAKKPVVPFMQRVKEFSVIVDKKETSLIARFEKLGIQPMLREKTVGSTSPHPISAGVRRIMTARAFGLFHELKSKRVVSLYGHPRDSEILNILQSGVAQEEQLELIVDRPLMVPQDIVRFGVGADGWPDNSDFLMVDIYMTEHGPFSPAAIRKFLRAGRTLIWLGHRFRGQVGHVFEEGVWARIDGKIHCFPDANAQMYTPHSPCDWIWADGSDGDLCWAWKEFTGDYGMVVFQRRALPRQRSAAPEPLFKEIQTEILVRPDGILQELAFQLFCELPILLRWWPRTSLVLNHELMLMVTDVSAGRMVGGPLYRQLLRASQEQVSKRPVWNRLRQQFPDQFGLVLEETVLAVLLKNLPQRAWMMRSVGITEGRNLEAYNRDLDNFGKSRSVTGWLINKIGSVFFHLFCGLLVYYLLKRFLTPRVPAWLVRWNIPKNCLLESHPVVSIVAEEAIRERYGSVGSVCLAAVDMIKTCVLGGVAGARAEKPFGQVLSETLIPAVSHLFFASCLDKISDMRLRIALHCLYNTLPGGFPLVLISSMTLIQEGLKRWGPLAQNPVKREGEVINVYIPTFSQEEANRMEESLSSDQNWQQFRDGVYGPSTVPTKADVDVGMGRGSITVETWEVPRSDATVGNPAVDSNLGVDGVWNVVEDEVIPNSVFYAVMPTNYPLFAPRRSDHNLYSVVQSRILVPPPGNPEDSNENWEITVPPGLIPQQPTIIRDDWVQPWLDHFQDAKHKNRYKSCREKEATVNLEQLVDKGVDIMIKTDEVVSKFDPDLERFVCKPRAIAVVSPDIQYFIGPVTYAASKMLFGLWNGDFVYHARSHDLIPIYCCGRDDLFLSEIMLKALACIRYHRPTFFVLVAGDDSLVVHPHHTPDGTVSFRFLEGDASMFDQSQGIGALANEYRHLAQLGVASEYTKMLHKISRSNYLVDSRKHGNKLRINRSKRPMRDTGGPDTSLGNSINMLCAWASVLAQNRLANVDEFSTLFLALGLKMKLKEYSSPTHPTFLKGKWWAVHHPDFSYAWGPLPSRVLKIGKSFSNPMDTYKMAFEPACEKFMADQASNLAQFLPVPLVSSFVAAHPGGKAELIEPWRIQGSGHFSRTRVCPDYFGDLWHRYGIWPEEIVEMEVLLSSKAPVFICHPAFVKLGLVDYS